MKSIFISTSILLFLGCQASAQNPMPGLTEKPTNNIASLPSHTPAQPVQEKPSLPIQKETTVRVPSEKELRAYAWLDDSMSIRTLEKSFPVPVGFTRVSHDTDSFGAWLRTLPLRSAGTPVYYYNQSVAYEASHQNIAAVAELDIGARDLHQCADSVIRFHAEWKWSQKDTKTLAYHFTSGDLASWKKYSSGIRPRVSGSKVTWSKRAKPSTSRKTFRSYLDLVFMYAGTLSLSKHATKIDRNEVQAGDFFVQGGSPGHAVLILDIATNDTGERIALLGQGFLPARDFHILSQADGNPWFSLESNGGVETPFWETFSWNSLRRL